MSCCGLVGGCSVLAGPQTSLSTELCAALGEVGRSAFGGLLDIHQELWTHEDGSLLTAPSWSITSLFLTWGFQLNRAKPCLSHTQVVDGIRWAGFRLLWERIDMVPDTKTGVRRNTHEGRYIITSPLGLLSCRFV